MWEFLNNLTVSQLLEAILAVGTLALFSGALLANEPLPEWERKCPLCGRLIRRPHDQPPTYCACGWLWR